MVKMIVVDLDGTLLDDDGNVSNYTLSILKECKRRNIYIAIATARSEKSCEEFIKILEPDIIIAEDGSVLIINNRIIYNNSESKKCYNKINELSIENNTLNRNGKHSLNDKLNNAIEKLLFNIFNANESNKMNAIIDVIKYLNISMLETVSFGDGFNDMEMIKECGVGVVVENGIQELKNMADYICRDNNHDGVAKWIEENILNK
jgi:hydroxymethylpyrimidine pyrophosphatase-like HAD family hydrolase